MKNEEILMCKTKNVYYFSFQIMKSFDKQNKNLTIMRWNAMALVDNV